MSRGALLISRRHVFHVPVRVCQLVTRLFSALIMQTFDALPIGQGESRTTKIIRRSRKSDTRSVTWENMTAPRQPFR